MVARVKAILRRTTRQTKADKTVLTYGEVVLDTKKRRLHINNNPVALTAHEYELLRALMSYPGKVFTRDELLEHLYPRGEALVIERVVDVHISKLRQKIEQEPSKPQYIVTVRGLGYKFEA